MDAALLAVVHHHDVGPLGARARLGYETFLAVAARASGTVLAGTGELRAQPLEAEAVQVPVGRRVQPVVELPELVFLLFGERPPAALHQLAEQAQAEVVGPPLQDGDAKLGHVRAEDLRGARKVGREQLALQVARGGGEDDGRIVREAPEDGRDQVGERLAHARAGLDHQVFAAVERARHGAQHVQLAGPQLVPRHAAQRAASLQMARGGVHIERRAVLVRRQAAFRPAGLQDRNEVVPFRIVHEERYLAAAHQQLTSSCPCRRASAWRESRRGGASGP